MSIYVEKLPFDLLASEILRNASILILKLHSPVLSSPFPPFLVSPSHVLSLSPFLFVAFQAPFAPDPFFPCRTKYIIYFIK